MAKKRYINTKFWDDNYIVELDPIEKLLFMYFLTNPLTDICGIYEIPLRRIAFDTGIDKDMVKRVIERFTLDKRVYFIDGYIYVKNFAKHQAANESIEKGIERSISLIPEEIIAKIRDVDTGCIQADPIVGTSSDLPKPKPKPKPKPIVAKSTTLPESEAISQVIEAFKEINPSYKTLFANKTERDCASRMTKEHGLNEILKWISVLPACNRDKYSGVNITTPYQLEKDAGKLKTYIEGQIQDQQTNQIINLDE